MEISNRTEKVYNLTLSEREARLVLVTFGYVASLQDGNGRKLDENLARQIREMYTLLIREIS